MCLWFVFVSEVKTMDCSVNDRTFPHEWNKAAYYQCFRTCPYAKHCPFNQYYSMINRKCADLPADWIPSFNIKGRYQIGDTPHFIDVDQSTYEVKWRSEDASTLYIFNGRYLNETMVTGLEISLVKRNHCIRLQQLDLVVVNHQHFCRSHAALHWYTRTCALPLSDKACHRVPK